MSRRRERLETVADELERTYDVETHVMPADLSDPEAPAALYESVVDAGLGVDVLVNNAGVGSYGPFLDDDASIAGWAPTPNSVVYSAAEHFERAFSEALAEGLAAQGITAAALCSDETGTGFFDRGDYDGSGAAAADRTSAAAVVEAGYRGLMAGERIGIPGGRNRLRAFLRRVLPRWLPVRTAREPVSK